MRIIKPLFCILGRSGAGKTTLCTALEKSLGIRQIPSYTTRPPRYEGEQGHTFVTDNQYARLGNILAENTTTGFKYCVTEKQINNPAYDLYVVDLTGLKMLNKRYRGNRIIIPILIDVPLKERYERLKNRYYEQYKNTDTAIDMALERIVSDAVEFNEVEKFCRFVVDNSDGKFQRALSFLETVIGMGLKGKEVINE